MPYYMKFIIEKVELIKGEKPTVVISWSSGTTDFYPWHSYPELPDLSEFKPWYYSNVPGLTLFRAPAAMTTQTIRTHNLSHYQHDPEQVLPLTLVPRLEKAVDEIEEVSQQHCLYFAKKRRQHLMATLLNRYQFDQIMAYRLNIQPGMTQRHQY